MRTENNEADRLFDAVEKGLYTQHAEGCGSHGTDTMSERFDCTCEVGPALTALYALAALAGGGADGGDSTKAVAALGRLYNHNADPNRERAEADRLAVLAGLGVASPAAPLAQQGAGSTGGAPTPTLREQLAKIVRRVHLDCCVVVAGPITDTRSFEERVVDAVFAEHHPSVEATVLLRAVKSANQEAMHLLNSPIDPKYGLMLADAILKAGPLAQPKPEETT